MLKQSVDRRKNILAIFIAFLLVILMTTTVVNAAAGQWGSIHVKFAASPTIGNAPLKVHFHDRTTFETGGKVVNRY